MPNVITREERVEKIGDIKCWQCKLSWNGHICLDNKLGFRLYCEVCDLFIPTEKEFSLFISLGNTGAVVDVDGKKLQKVLDPFAKCYSNLPKDHPVRQNRRHLIQIVKQKRENDEPLNDFMACYADTISEDPA